MGDSNTNMEMKKHKYNAKMRKNFSFADVTPELRSRTRASATGSTVGN
jgi:hypothetical protein